MNMSGANSNRIRELRMIGLICFVVALGSISLDFNFGLAPNPAHFLRGALLAFGVVVMLSGWWRTRRRP
ncbi:hypothetical protein [Dyella sp. 20L07]|uniref:hypothetical protein n=1 Tax=Dyella sp. 20L07 TaxID=3384240 RepID=UPI003D2AB877